MLLPQMMKFDYFFGISLGLLILQHTDNHSKAMQRADMSAAEGQDITAMTVTTLKSLHNKDSFNLYWKKTTAAATNLDIDEPILPVVERLLVGLMKVVALLSMRQLRIITE